MDDISLGSYPRPRLCPLCLRHDKLWTALVTVSLLWSYSGHLFTSFCHLPSHPPPSASCPLIPLATLAQNWCTPSKNDLKWPEIKQVTDIKLHYKKANTLLCRSSSAKDSWPNTSKSWVHQLKILKRGFPQSLSGAN